MPVVALQEIIRLVRRAVPGETAGLSDAELVERFLDARDEAAFELLIWRHGPMVLGVARRLLRDQEDIEDTFQATFHAFARKAKSIGKRQAVGSWLHKVAYRIALDAGRLRARRAANERPLMLFADIVSSDDVTAQAARREAHATVDAEISRLPRKYRDPVVLCYLEGMTQEQSARALGLAKGTVSTRLTRARQMLRRRLAHLNEVLSSAALPVGFGECARLATPTLAAVFASNETTATMSLMSAKALSLADAAIRGMAATKWTITLTFVLLTAALGSGVALLGYRTMSTKPPATVSVHPQLAIARPSSERLDRYGDPLPPKAQARMGTVRWRHSDGVSGIVFSADGKTVATSGHQDGFIHLWEADSGRKRLQLDCGKMSLKGLDRSTDGRTLVTTGYLFDLATREIRGRLLFWDFETLKPLLQIERKDWRPSTVRFSPDGQRVATGAEDGNIHVWHAVTGHEQLHFPAHEQVIFSLAFSPDGRTLASASTDDTIRLWNVARGTESCKLEMRNGRFSSRLAFSPDGSSLAAVERRHTRANETGSNDVVFWNVTTGEQRRRFAGDNYSGRQAVNLLDVVYSPDGKTLISTQNDRTLVYWDTASGRCLCKVTGPSNGTSRLVFSPDGKTLAGGAHKTVHQWEVATGRELSVDQESHQSWVSQAFYSPDGKTLFTSGDDSTIRLWDPMTGRQRLRIDGHDYWVRALALSPDGKTLASSSLDDTVRLWDAATGKELVRLPGHGKMGGHRCLAFEPDGKSLASWGDDWQLRIWEVTTGKPIFKGRPRLAGIDELPDMDDEKSRIKLMELRMLASAPTFAPDGSKLFIPTLKTLHVVDVTTRKESGAIPNVPPNGPLTISPDGKRFAIRAQNAARIFDLNGKDLLTLTGPGPIEAIAFSADSQTLAASSEVGRNQGMVRLWELSTSEILLDVRCPAPVYSLAFSPDGKSLATALADTTVLVWDVAVRKASRFRRIDSEKLRTGLDGDNAAAMNNDPAGP